MIGLDEYDGEQQTTSELPEKPLKEWRRKFEAGNLDSSNLMQYFQAASPFFFTIDQTAEYSDLARCSFDEQGAKNAIIDVLEEFVFGDNPETVLAKIRSEENASTVCGRVFKMNEPFYSCRECGMDPTCVLCVNCFKQSAHRHHKYKMGTSAGGGCCDCGDNEAWKQDHYCDEHKGSEKMLQSNVITERMRDRCMIVFDAILNYCVRSLKIEANGSIKNLETQEEDVYCTVLYNDETHTFDQVINTLTRIVGWQQKDAVEYVSTIDREGRAVVKCSTFQSCLKLKNDIENQSLRSTVALKPSVLKVAVLHKNDVAYQQFSLQLLAWFQEFLTRHALFRFLFCEILKQSTTDYSLREILTNDSLLWKTARTSWHHLLISGMLMEYENKKTLAVMFTRQYTRIMQDFISNDDHDHSFSIVSMSVQLFTVPSIAQHLIANEDAFYKLMYTFYSESIEKYVKKKTLQFTRNAGNMNIFKRAAFILYDIKYILSFKPLVWTDELRANFLHGVQMLIKLLREMQGMDSVFRQTGQHMEYEPEWESAFNLHIKLAPVISLVLDWCSSDRVVLIKVYRMVMSALTETDFIVSQPTTEIKELADHSVWCLMYDVGTKPVSIHLPLSRFFAGLYLHLEKFNLTFDTVPLKKLKPDQTIEPRPDQIIEPVLCTLTMVAQVHAGMWRRNGYSLLNQLYFYRNVKCRAEMLDRDIVALQIGASLIESNEFLIHLVNKFNLINWASPDYEATSLQNPEEDSIRQVINMVDELLELIIVIVGERHVPGVGMVTEEDKIKKEIIQYLCIKPYSHSELSRTLPDCQNDEDIEDIIDSVAVFKKPSQSDKMGVYELKPQYFDEYNMYFYHYTKEEKSKSEEEQRKRRKAKKELVCCPPPKMPQLTPLFSMLANLLQCDVMLLIMHTVLKRAIDLKARSFSESHLQKVLHLIGYAVQEQEGGAYPFFTFCERASKWDILPMMEELTNSPRVEAHRDLIMWTVRKYKSLQKSENQQMESDENGASGSEPSQSAAETAADAEKAEKEDRARLAAERRAKIMAQIASAQKSFMSSNSALFLSTTTAVQDKNETAMEWQDNTESNSGQICLGPDRKHRFIEDLVVTCILCSEDAVVSKTNSPCMVYSAFVQKSHVLLPLDTMAYPHTNSCGHVMHASCWKEYFNNEVLKENRRPNRNRSQGMTTDKKEFLCPLCRCLSNAVIPILPALSRIVPSQNVQPYTANDDETQINNDDIEPMPFDKWLYFMQNYNGALHLIADLPEISSDIITKLPDLESIVKEFTSIEAFIKLAPPTSRDQLPSELLEYVNEFASSAKRAAPNEYTDEVIESHIVTWISCTYTIQTLEMYLRALNKPLKGQMSIRQTSCLYGLVRESALLVTTVTDEIAAKLLLMLRSQLGTLFMNSSSCLIEWDLFRMLTTFIFFTSSVLYTKTRQCIFPNGTLLEHYFLKTIFLALITKILVLYNIDESVKVAEATVTEEVGERTVSISMDIDGGSHSMAAADDDDKQTPTEAESSSSSSSNVETDVLIEFYNNHNFYVIDARGAGVAPPASNKTQKQLKELIMKAIRSECRVFLRCACLLFQSLTDIDLPDELFDSDGDRFEVMCEYLGLSSDIEYYLKCESINSFMSNLAMHPDIEIYRTKQRAELSTVLVPCIPTVRKLVDLPVDYSDLINTVLTFSCPNNDRDESSRNPTMCLVCGVTLCSMTYCCQYEIEGSTVGACTHHAHECGAGVGIFLRIRECDILLLGVNKGSFVPPPYLDKYGETDQGLRRGNPLKLCPERYQKLNLLWLNHGLHEDIARSAESINNVIPTQWQHL